MFSKNVIGKKKTWTVQDCNGVSERKVGSSKENDLYVEISFYEILVQQFDYDPYEANDNEKKDGNGDGNNNMHDHEERGTDNVRNCDKNVNSNDAMFQNNMDKNVEWFGVDNHNSQRRNYH